MNTPYPLSETLKWCGWKLSPMANLGRLFSDGIILILIMVLEYFTIRPFVGDLIGLGLLGITAIYFILRVLKNIL
jgi:hypothetical protein